LCLIWTKKMSSFNSVKFFQTYTALFGGTECGTCDVIILVTSQGIVKNRCKFLCTLFRNGLIKYIGSQRKYFVSSHIELTTFMNTAQCTGKGVSLMHKCTWLLETGRKPSTGRQFEVEARSTVLGTGLVSCTCISQPWDGTLDPSIFSIL
jgi:hypothetical protein